MNPRDYLAIRKTYNAMRQDRNNENRLTFEELAILSYLYESGPVSVSKIAEYQQVSRPTMTHRGNHLSDLGYIERKPGQIDRRQVSTELTEEGKEALKTELQEIFDTFSDDLKNKFGKDELDFELLRKQILAMSRDEILAGSLVLFSFCAIDDDEEMNISKIVELTGLLQPTVSMSVARLERAGLLHRQHGSVTSRRTTIVTVTDEGQVELDDMVKTVDAMETVY